MTKKQGIEKEQSELIKRCYDDGSAEINGNKYEFHKMRHKERRKVFTFLTHVQHDIAREDLWFIESPEFEQVETIINNSVTVNGSSLSKKTDHWEEHPEDYFKFIMIALPVISYPFMKGGLTS